MVLVNTEIQLLNAWFISNRLSLNVAKTNYIIFCDPRKKYNSSAAKLLINGNVINQIKYAKFLGIYIDEHLNWKEHIKQVSSKVAKNIGVLRRLKPFNSG